MGSPQDAPIEAALKHLLHRRDELQRRIAEAQRQLKADSQDLAKVDQAIVGLRPLVPPSLLEKLGPALAAIVTLAASLAATGNQDQSPSASALIVQIVGERGQMTDAEIVDAMVASGWKSTSDNPLGLIRSYLSRLVHANHLVRVGPSTYQRTVLPTATSLAARLPGTTEAHEER